MKRIPVPVLLLAAAAMLAGCSLNTPYPNRALYTITAADPAGAATRPANPRLRKITLRVRRILAVPPYGGAAFVYRTAPNRLETDYYNAFAAAPADLLTAQLVEYLRASNQFGAVIDANSGMAHQWALEGRLQQLLIDTTNPASPRAVLTMQIVVLDDRDPAPRAVLEKTYTERVPLAGTDPKAAAQGWSTACDRLFAQLEMDLASLKAPE